MPKRLLFGIALVFLPAAACDGLVPAPAAADAAAALTFGCPAERVALKRVNTHGLIWFDGGGCGKTGAFYCWKEYVAGKETAPCGPVPSSGKTTALRKASEKMKCDIDKIKIDDDASQDPQDERLSSADIPDSVKRHWQLAGQYDVKGCGKTVTVQCNILPDQPVATCH